RKRAEQPTAMPPDSRDGRPSRRAKRSQFITTDPTMLFPKAARGSGRASRLVWRAGGQARRVAPLGEGLTLRRELRHDAVGEELERSEGLGLADAAEVDLQRRLD